ncbi:hypothetical protein F5879DRAFT_1024258 [Lentinula edodes]|uniref:uncharacterized protein n=1 Tax=Lentinula edodes TaxID=5353 RepID=UPI001E8E6397|nr:uncharacterized protein C8R40DRAFT_1268267 [Lentinula edodes]KAH7870120.1 hypothetical protein C8R40DRAFT_1268267 [Lentinula edodes]KAJ3902299.1 hypothetical protein F5879DRAFT_1024258 [Lentinula edodes]
MYELISFKLQQNPNDTHLKRRSFHHRLIGLVGFSDFSWLVAAADFGRLGIPMSEDGRQEGMGRYELVMPDRKFREGWRRRYTVYTEYRNTEPENQAESSTSGEISGYYQGHLIPYPTNITNVWIVRGNPRKIIRNDENSFPGAMCQSRSRTKWNIIGYSNPGQ